MSNARIAPADDRRPRFTCLGEALDNAPRCPGVYRFFSVDDVLLYVGKSVDVGTRLNSHLSSARTPGRQQRMMTAVERVDCELTAGDVGAQLLENSAIKTEAPLYNRAQRRGRKLWTQRLHVGNDGYLRVTPSDFHPAGERSEAVYGLFRSRTQIYATLRTLAREEGLCLRVLGVESGRGPCFQSQVGRCRGACCGHESPATHNERLLAALGRQRIAAWPFAGAVLLHEVRGKRLHEQQPARQYHVLSHWSYLGSFARRDQARRRATADHTLFFDRDSYHIIYRALRGGACELLDADGRETLPNPFRNDAGWVAAALRQREGRDKEPAPDGNKLPVAPGLS